MAKTPHETLLSEYVLMGTSRMLGKAFGITRPLIATEESYFSALKARSNEANRDGQLDYPYSFLEVTNIAPNLNGSYNPKALSRHGRLGAKNTDRTKQNKLLLVPTIFQVSWRYFDNDVTRALSVAQLTVFHSIQAGPLSFELTYAGLNLSIRAAFMPDGVAFPRKNSDSDTRNEFALETNMVIDGYTNDNQIHEVDLLHQTQEPRNTFAQEGTYSPVGVTTVFSQEELDEQLGNS